MIPVFFRTLETIKSFGLKLLLPVMAFLAPIKFLLILVGISIAVDTIIGIWGAVKKGGWPAFSSKKLRRFAPKIIVYNLVVITMYIMDIYLLGEIMKLFIDIPLAVTKFTTLTLISIEIFSIDETLRKVNGRGIWYYLKKLIGSVKSLKKETDGIIDK